MRLCVCDMSCPRTKNGNLESICQANHQLRFRLPYCTGHWLSPRMDAYTEPCFKFSPGITDRSRGKKNPPLPLYQILGAKKVHHQSSSLFTSQNGPILKLPPFSWVFHAQMLCTSNYCIVCILQEKETQKQVIWFNFQKTKYVYDSEEKKQFCQVAFPISEAMEHYNSCRGYQEETEVERAKKKYGLNE